MEETGDKEQNDSSKGATKTWGFRRSTIARREFMEEIGNLDLISVTPRQSAHSTKGRGRGRGRGKQNSESTSAVPATKRGRGGRRSAPVSLDPVASPASADSLDTPMLGADERKSAESATALCQTSGDPEFVSDVEAITKAAASDQAEDSDELTLRELQERVRNRRKMEVASSGDTVSTKLKNNDNIKKEAEEGNEQTQDLRSEENIVPEHHKAISICEVSSRSARRSNKSKKAAKGVCRGAIKKQDEEESDESSDEHSEEDDPNAVYCICRQRHNNRFMICCDRCQEWFHGDCVGITEARGCLLEENGEDYICCICSPCPSPVDIVQKPILVKAELSSSSESLFSSSAGEGRPSEDEGIKGKIRKASSQRIKRRIKIFPKVEIVEAALPNMAEKVKEDAAIEQKPGPKCIGPGCINSALPESVYCGHQCIIKHAAVAMQTLSEPKPLPEEPDKPAAKPAPKMQKQLFLEKLFKKKPVEKPTEEGNGSSKKSGVMLEKEEPTVAPQPCDVENKEMGEQQSSAVPTSMFYKSSMYHPGATVCTAIKTEKAKVESEADPQPVLPQNQSQSPSPSSEGQTAPKTVEKSESTAIPFRKPGSSPFTSRAKKTMPGSQRLSGPRHRTDVPQSNKDTCPSQTKKAPGTNEAPVATQSTPDFGPVRELRILPVSPAPAPPPRPLQPHPNMQMRQNIRRSLTEALLKRVTDSDGLDMPESDIGKLAVNIEREMFNMYYTTDNKYKTKYKFLLLSLKDPKNKALFYQVVNGQITPFKLTRMSQQELQAVQEITSSFIHRKEESPDVCANVEDSLSVQEDKAETIATSSEEKNALPQVKAAQPRNVSNAFSDIISTMLKDTTSEHRTHLFDLKCKICTGQIPVHDDAETRKHLKEETKNEEEKTPRVVEKPPITESPASPVADDSTSEGTLLDSSPAVIPTVSVVSITRRDPRKVAHRAAPSPSPAPTSVCTPLPTQNPPALPANKEELGEAKVVEPMVPPPLPMPKSILMKPSATSVSRFYNSSNSNMRMQCSNKPPENETSQFLSKQDTVWKGFLNMQSVAKFVTKAYTVSGSSELLKKELPDTIHIGGRILPQTVWEYVERVKTSVTKELSLIRFHPASDEEEVAYVSLFSYFNSRRRFGVVSNICNNIKDLYLIPLCAKEAIPAVLLPLEGPGLEPNRPNLLIGLAICQKLKRPGTLPQEIAEKRLQTPLDAQTESAPIQSAVSDVKHDESEPYDPDIPISTTPPGSPPPIQLPDSSSAFSSSLSGSSVLSDILSAVNPIPASANSTKATSSSFQTPSVASSSSTTTPLQTILNTLFGKKKQDLSTENAEPNSSAAKLPASTLSVDPIVQQYQHTAKNTIQEEVVEDDNDRPYDPEEEYNPVVGCQSSTPVNPIKSPEPNTVIAAAKDNDDDRPYDPEEEYNLRDKASVSSPTAMKSTETEAPVDTSALNDIAYDPEDETVFDEIQTYITGRSTTSEYGTASAVSLSEQKKMLEELNRQIEEQKRQLEEQEEAFRLHRAAVGVSMAHFSVSDALMSPPPCFGREPDDATEKTLPIPEINPSRDPRQCRKDSAKLNVLDDKENSLYENMDKSKIKLLPNQSTLSSPANISEGQGLVLGTQSVLQKDSDMPSVKTDVKMSTVDTNATSDETMGLSSVTTMNSSELPESSRSLSGNENRQQSPGKRRRSHTSRRETQSSSKRSRHDHRSSHKDRGSHTSSSEADKYHRRGRPSPDRSPTRSHSHTDRRDRLTSRQRVRRHSRSTSSKHRNRRDQHSTRSRSTHSKKSGDPENGECHQKDLRKSRSESAQNHSEQTRNVNRVSSQPLCIQSHLSSDPPASTFSPHDPSLRHSPVQSEKILKPKTEQDVHENKPLSAGLSMDILCIDHKTSNREQGKELKDNFGQKDQLKGSQQKEQCIVSQPSESHLFIESDQHHVISQGLKAEPLQKEGYSQDASNRFHQSNKTQSEHSLMQKDDQFHKNRDQQSNNSKVISYTDEQSVDSLQRQTGDMPWPETDHRGKVLQKTMQTDREDFSDSEKVYGRNQSLSNISVKRRPTGAHRSTIPDSEADHVLQNENMVSFQRPNFPLAAEDQSKPRNSLPPHKRDFTLDEPDQYHHYPKRSFHATEREFSPSENLSQLSTEKYSGPFPLDESKPQHQKDLPYHLPRLQGTHFLEHEAEQLKIKDISPQIHRCSLSIETDQFPHQDYPSQRTHSVARAHSSEECSNFRSRDQLGPRQPDDKWRDPQYRNDGIRGPPSMMAPRGPAQGPRARHPVSFDSCGPPSMGPCPRPRIIDSTQLSPKFGPRGLSSGLEMPRGPRPQTLRHKGSSSGDGTRNSFRPPLNFQPSSGPYCPRHIMDVTTGPHQSRQPSSSETSGPQHLIFDEFDNRDSHLSHINDPMGHYEPQQLDREDFDSEPVDCNIPRGHVVRKMLDKRRTDYGETQPHNFNDSRDYSEDIPFDYDEIDNAGFHHQPVSEPRGNTPLCHSDSRSHNYNSGSNCFRNPQELSHQREFPFPYSHRQNETHSRNLRCGSPHQSLFDGPQVLEMESDIRGLQQFNEYKGQILQRETGRPRFAKSHVFEGGKGCESDAQVKGPRFNAPRNFSEQTFQSPIFHGQRMDAVRKKAPCASKPFSPRFPNTTAPTTAQVQRLEGPNSHRVRPRKQSDGPPEELEIRPLRLSGPLLPTPPGGPIRLNNPRMQRPHPYKDPNFPQCPPSIGKTTEPHHAGIHTGCFDDTSDHRIREPSQSHTELSEVQGENDSGQDSSPGKPWQRRRARRREVRNRATRRPRIMDNSEGAGDRGTQ